MTTQSGNGEGGLQSTQDFVAIERTLASTLSKVGSHRRLFREERSDWIGFFFWDHTSCWVQNRLQQARMETWDQLEGYCSDAGKR